MTAAELPTLRLGGKRLPVVLPSLRDARLHTAATILSVHAIGVTALGFRVSVIHILAAILTAGLIDVVISLRQTGQLVWPASGMLTGSGVALILRLVEARAHDYWQWQGWHLYALVAGASVLTKHVLRWRGSHLFNPSNVGLVAVFLLLGSDVVEPLDFWWAPLGPWMIVAYVVILGGGIAITRRLSLLGMAATFWVVLAVGLGVLAGSGHCMIATWSPDPVCDQRFWWALVTSPEILIFQFFMITDPKTSPRGQMARGVYAAVMAVLATLLIAPQETEFGAKVGLLSSLVVLTPFRELFDKWLPESLSLRIPAPRSSTAFAQGIGIGATLAAVAVGIVVAGVPARRPAAASVTVSEVTVAIDIPSLPQVTVGSDIHTSGLQARAYVVCGGLPEKKKRQTGAPGGASGVHRVAVRGDGPVTAF